MFFKALSLCALALSGAACAAAQGISPGRYTIGSSIVLESSRNAQVRNSSHINILIVPGNGPFPVFPGNDQWELAPGQSGGFIMQNVAFGNFLTLGSDDLPAGVVATGTRDQATSFAITSAGSGQFHINVVAQDLLWTVPGSLELVTATTPDGKPVFTADTIVSVQPANGGQDQLWRFTRI